VVAAPIDDGFVIALPYGMNTDWLRNVLSNRWATITFDGEVCAVDEPAVVPIQDVTRPLRPARTAPPPAIRRARSAALAVEESSAG
jgi:hypothetical protein